MALLMVFPGQGAQSPGMLAAHRDHAVVAATLAEADQALGMALSALIDQGPSAELDQTINAQPALLATSVALYRLWRAQGGPEPTVLAGHSLGEYSALVVAQALDYADGLRLVRARGQAMQAAVPARAGAMAAVLGAPADQIEAICHEVSSEIGIVSAANYNEPRQTVIAGTAAAVAVASERLKAAGVRRIIALDVSVPSHCALMAPAQQALATALAQTTLRRSQVRVVHNVDLSDASTSEAISERLLAQLVNPVRWTQTISMLAADQPLVVECGPGKVLAGLCGRIAPELKVHGLATVDGFAAAIEAAR